jgi:hypothetical protein
MVLGRGSLPLGMPAAIEVIMEGDYFKFLEFAKFRTLRASFRGALQRACQVRTIARALALAAQSRVLGPV